MKLDCSDLVAANLVECREPASSSTCTPRVGCVRYVRVSWRLLRPNHKSPAIQVHPSIRRRLISWKTALRASTAQLRHQTR